jgi:glycosyltransferase involved in cell wall biosynthesis
MCGPLVSLVIVAYNQAAFIGEALDGALAQDYKALEIIVSDDSSTDGTNKIIQEYSSRNPTHIVPVFGERNLGVTGNCNRALAACRGKYIAFQGGDDILLPGKIEAQVAWMEEDDHRVLCGHDAEYFESTSGAKLGLRSEIHPMWEGEGARSVVQHGPPYLASAVMVKADAIPDYGFDERLPIVSDWKLWIDCLSGGGKFGYIDSVYTRYRISSESITATRKFDLIKDKLIAFDIIEKQYPQLKRACRTGRALAFYRMGILLMKQRDYPKAQKIFNRSLCSCLHCSWKVPIALILTYLPMRWSYPMLKNGVKPRNFWGFLRSLRG